MIDPIIPENTFALHTGKFFTIPRTIKILGNLIRIDSTRSTRRLILSSSCLVLADGKSSGSAKKWTTWKLLSVSLLVGSVPGNILFLICCSSLLPRLWPSLMFVPASQSNSQAQPRALLCLSSIFTKWRGSLFWRSHSLQARWDAQLHFDLPEYWCYDPSWANTEDCTNTRTLIVSQTVW